MIFFDVWVWESTLNCSPEKFMCNELVLTPSVVRPWSTSDHPFSAGKESTHVWSELFATRRRPAYRGCTVVRECPRAPPSPASHWLPFGCLPRTSPTPRRRPASRGGAGAPGRSLTVPPPRAAGGRAVAGVAAGAGGGGCAGAHRCDARRVTARGESSTVAPRSRLGGGRRRQRRTARSTAGAQAGAWVTSEAAHRRLRPGWSHPRRAVWRCTSTPGACDRQQKNRFASAKKKATTQRLPYATSTTGAARSGGSACAHGGRDKRWSVVVA